VLQDQTWLLLLAEFGLTQSIPKTKLLVVRVNLTANDIAPLELGGGSVEMVKELGPLIEACGGEVNCRITQATITQATKFFWSPL